MVQANAELELPPAVPERIEQLGFQFWGMDESVCYHLFGSVWHPSLEILYKMLSAYFTICHYLLLHFSGSDVSYQNVV